MLAFVACFVYMRRRIGPRIPLIYTVSWTNLYCRRQQSMKQRFEVYVCTAAERGYALEAWRVLDPKVSSYFTAACLLIQRVELGCGRSLGSLNVITGSQDTDSSDAP